MQLLYININIYIYKYIIQIYVLIYNKYMY